jgi:hypothetical protein
VWDRFAARVDLFLFAPANPKAVALFRALFSAYLALLFWPHVREVTRGLRGYEDAVAFYDHVFFAPWYGVVVALVLLAFGASFRPRVSGFLLILLLTPLVATSLFGYSRQIAVTSLAALWLFPGPARGGRSTLKAPIWPIRLIQLELAAVYGWNAIAKATPDYLSGRVLVEMSTTLPNFLVDLSDGYLHLGFLAIPVWLCAWATVLIEGTLAVGFWFRRTLWATAALGVGFHVILMRVVEIGFLDWTQLFLYLAFLLPFERPAVWRGVTGGSGMA